MEGELNCRKCTLRKQWGKKAIYVGKNICKMGDGDRILEVVEIRWEVVFISQCSNVRMEGGKGHQRLMM